MAALTAGRDTPRRDTSVVRGRMAADTVFFAGALIMRNAAGDLIEGATATGMFGVGVAETTFDNTGGSAGDVIAAVRPGLWLFENSASADELANTDIGAVCYIVDDQTVAKTDGSSARSPAGMVAEVTTDGVWVHLDEMRTRNAVAAAA